MVTTPGGSQETVVRRVFEPGKEYKVNLAQVQLTLQPLDGEGEPTGTRAQLPLGGSTTLSEVPDDQGISYAPGWMMPPGGRLVVGYGLDTGSLQVHEMKRDLHKPMAKLSYTLALVNP